MNDTIPEGLYLTLDANDDIVINDAGDVTWLRFFRGGVGDPANWSTSIITKTCENLGITTAISPYCDVETIEEFLKNWGYE